VITWRHTLVIGAFFIVVGILYFLTQGDGSTIDRAGVIMLLLAGVSMAFGFAVLVRGSRDL
jgi:drug/metabolite transporter (DMT)-like permease